MLYAERKARILNKYKLNCAERKKSYPIRRKWIVQM
jgi:hypothetical protein